MKQKIKLENLEIKIAEIKKENEELKNYLKHIKNYRDYWEKRIHSINSVYSIVYKLWQWNQEYFNVIKLARKRQENKKIWNEILSQSQTKKLDIYNFSVIPYEFRHLRQQHLAEELAKKGHRIFYIENEFIPQKKPSRYSSFKIRKYKENIYLVTLSAPRKIFIYSEKPEQDDINAITTSFNSLKTKIKSSSKSVAKIDYPFWGYLAPKLNMPVIYDCMDDYEGFEQTEKHILDIERNLLKNSELVLVCSNLLKEKLKRYLPKDALLLKNAGQYEHFKVAEEKNLKTPQDIIKVKKPILGYFGAIGEFIDVPLIEKIAQKYSNASIVLIGELRNQAVIDLASKYNNIFTLGEKPYSTLPAYLQEFSVCLIPFVVSKSTQLIDPVKLYEYLASGKPVVASDIKEIYEYKDACFISKNNNEFIKNVEIGLKENNKRLKEKRQKIARVNTWEVRGKVLNSAIEALVKDQ